MDTVSTRAHLVHAFQKIMIMFRFESKLIVFVVIAIVILSVTFILHLFETQDSFKIENVVYKKGLFIEIKNRGITPNTSLVVKNTYFVNKIIKFIKTSQPVKQDDISVKAHIGLYEIIFHYANDKDLMFILTDTTFSGGIIQSRGFFYRNDRLLKYIIDVLKANPHCCR
jgi:hydrogenase maturation factor HypF (carbamoyltransferase family)